VSGTDPTVRGAVLRSRSGPVRVEEIDLAPPGPGQVRVRLAATGVCHSDLSLSDGTLKQPLPVVLGHEGAGTVVAVGPEVSRVRPGARVLLNWWPACGSCPACRRGQSFLCPAGAGAGAQPYAKLGDGTPVYAGLGTAAFAEETVVDQRAVIELPDELPLVEAAVLGCAVLTGFGAVMNSARVRPGETVAVFGVGGVGMSALQTARIAGAGQVIAVDAAAGKEELARAQGADAFVLSGSQAPAEIRTLTGGGADHVIECVGRAETIRYSWESTRVGGRTTIVGVGGRNEQITFSALEFFRAARTLAVCVYGDSDPVRDIGVIADEVLSGRLRLDALITDRIELTQVPEAFERMTSGRGGRSLIVF
jgi:S-(hydroxymethyl)glutathione dehydrogenase/alcohol dehydrogenase